MNWFHEPLITPATAFFCFIGLVVMDLLYIILRKAIKEAKEPDTDPYCDAHGDVPRDGRR